MASKPQNDKDAPQGAPQSVARVTRILEILASAQTAVSLADLARQLDAPKSSLSSLMKGLIALDYVTADTGNYQLGPAAFTLGSSLLSARRRLQSADFVRDSVRRLARKTGETSLFAVRDADGMKMTYLEVAESENSVRYASSPGDQRPLYCTAGGRAILAALADSAIEQYMAHLQPEALASSTITQRSQIMAQIGLVRQQGYARTTDEAADGVTGTAVAVTDSKGEPLGALIVAAPSSRRGLNTAELAREVAAEAELISQLMRSKTD